MSKQKNIVKISLSPITKSLLEIELSKRGYGNYSKYIKEILFGKKNNIIEKTNSKRNEASADELISQVNQFRYFQKYHKLRFIEDSLFVKKYASEKYPVWERRTMYLYFKNEELLYYVMELIPYIESITDIDVPRIQIDVKDMYFPLHETYYKGAKIEKRKEYDKHYTSATIHIRFNESEYESLKTRMEKDGWLSFNGFIRYTVFGLHPENKIKKEIKTFNKKYVGLLFTNILADAIAKLEYAKYCYAEDMHFWQMTGPQEFDYWVTLEKRWQKRFTKILKAILEYSESIIKTYGIVLDEKGEHPYEDLDMSNKEELDRLAEELRNEILEQHGIDIAYNATQTLAFSGRLLADARIINDKNGRELLFFKVDCSNNEQDEDTSFNHYSCVYNDTGYISLKKGDQVFVDGILFPSLKIDDKGEPHMSLIVKVINLERGKTATRNG